jgi:hypothetical protein
MSERRVEERGALRFTVRWEARSGTHHGQVRNLSGAGCFVEATVDHVEKRETVRLQFSVGRAGLLLLDGEVIHVQEIGFGLRFAELTKDERNAIAELVITKRARLL